MTLVAVSPFAGLLGLFAAVPICIACGICGAEWASAHKRRPKRAERP